MVEKLDGMGVSDLMDGKRCGSQVDLARMSGHGHEREEKRSAF